MRAVKVLLVVGIAVILAGCPAPSLQPLFTERDLIFDPGLVGTWANKDGTATWVLKRSGAKSYDVLRTAAEGEPHRFKLYLLQLGVYRFLDLSPQEELNFKDGFFESHWIATHTFCMIRKDGDTLQAAALEGDYLKPLIATKKTRIAQMLGGRVILTGSTKELQDYVLKHVEEEGAFMGPGEFHRVK